jgi:hypothetical protein
LSVPFIRKLLFRSRDPFTERPARREVALDRSGRKKDQLIWIAQNQRQVRDLLAGDHAPDLGIVQIDRGHRLGDGDFLGDSAWCERCMEVLDLIHRKLNSRIFHRFEAGFLD